MSELAPIILDGAEVDLLEAALLGYLEPSDLLLRVAPTPTREPDGGPHGVTFYDAENTPIGHMELVPRGADTDGLHAGASEARSGGLSSPTDQVDGVQSDTIRLGRLTPLRPLAQQHGIATDPRYRVVAATAAQYFAAGRPAIVIDALPTFADIEGALSAVREAMGTAQRANDSSDGVRRPATDIDVVWCVTVARGAVSAGGGTDLGERTARVVAAMITAGEISGDLVLIPAISDETAPEGRALDLSDPHLDVESVLRRLGASTVVGCSGTLSAELERIAPKEAVSEYRNAACSNSSRGAVVLFTGLSGSGKSTVAKAFAAEVEARGAAQTLVVDGDEARQMLSAGLGFDRASRDLNVERLGYVASMAASLGALAVMAPIAPFDEARQRVRQRAQQVGDFVLVHISTPLEVCEARDRKGLYAKARAGQIPDFTGISSPYEEPADADLSINTGEISVDDAVAMVWDLVADRLDWSR